MKILETVITTAVTAKLSDVFSCGEFGPAAMLIQAELIYGSGGTTLDAWLQTSIDGGESWIDVCNFKWTTSGDRRLYNLSALTPVGTVYTATDGTLTANTSKDGVIGHLWRVKYTSTGTYGGNTTLKINLNSPGVKLLKRI